MPLITENPQLDKIIFCFGGACPKCIRDKEHYNKLPDQSSEQMCWFDTIDKNLFWFQNMKKAF